MITYDTIIKTVSEIVNNELIYKEGLTLVYSLDERTHRKLNEHFYYKTKPEGIDPVKYDNDFEHTKEFEVNLGGIIIKFDINEKS